MYDFIESLIVGSYPCKYAGLVSIKISPHTNLGEKGEGNLGASSAAVVVVVVVVVKCGVGDSTSPGG